MSGRPGFLSRLGSRRRGWLVSSLGGLVTALAMFSGTACDDGDNATVLTVFADTSLKDAFEAVEASYERANPGVNLRFQFDDSLKLVERLRSGATADVVVLASRDPMQPLEASGLLQSSVDVTTNSLVVATRDGLTGLDAIEDLANRGLSIAAAAPDTVAGTYADSGIDAAATDLGSEWKQSVLNNIGERDADVRDVLERVRKGEVDAGIVYRSDLTSLAIDVGIGALPFPARLGLAVVYPAALTAQPPEVVLAKAFLGYMLSDDGQSILESFGFGASQ